jgi:3-hydroxyisobutyrate dehydrogenase
MRNTVAFLGLGVMGSGMAARIADAGLPLAVWNRSRERAGALGARGVRVADSPREAAAAADVVIAMIANDPASREVWLGPDGALAGAQPGAVLIESSTLSPRWIEELAGEAAARGCEFLDAPVTGSKSHAAGGQLRFLVGGRAETLDRVRPVLATMSRDLLHLGPTGSGARMKLINNFLCGVQAASLAEAIVLIERSGLDRDTAFSVLAGGAPGSPLVNAAGLRMTQADYAVNFALTLMHKDLSYAAAEAERADVPFATAEAARDVFGRAIAAGWGDADFSAVIEPLRQAR